MNNNMNNKIQINKEQQSNTAKSADKFKTIDLAYMGLFIALLTICSWISIPTSVPFTLQTFAVFTAVGILGTKKGTLSVVTYIILGILGVPVFSGFKAGIGAVLGPTGGYLLGFVIEAFVAGIIIHKFGDSIFVMAAAMIIGLIICYAFGTIYFTIVYSNNVEHLGLGAAIIMCVVPFIIPDLLKISLAIFVTKRVKRQIR